VRAKVDHAVTWGTFCLDGQTFDVENNVWVVGNTLFAGGPGATGRSFSDFGTIIASIREKLLSLPEDAVVHPGHGPDTTIGTEAPDLQDWIARGH
jgi:glyoxylase-like metal-dependent hydrolase (beta-lactamase superfamily II)